MIMRILCAGEPTRTLEISRERVARFTTKSAPPRFFLEPGSPTWYDGACPIRGQVGLSRRRSFRYDRVEVRSLNPEQKVTVRGDRVTAYANIIQVLDVCKSEGIQEPYLDTVVTE